MHGHPALAGGEIMRSLFSGAGQPCRLVQIVQDDRDRQERYNSGFSVVKMNSDISPRRTRRESNEIVKSNDPVGFRDCENEALPFYPPSQKATRVNPWMNARWVPFRSLGERRVRFGGFRPSKRVERCHGRPAFVAKATSAE